jgi:hypothetical protein
MNEIADVLKSVDRRRTPFQKWRQSESSQIFADPRLSADSWQQGDQIGPFFA